jgi:hypothetical protein
VPKRWIAVLCISCWISGMPVGVALGASPTVRSVRSVDDELVQIGRQIPGFGGLFYDEQGRPTVYLLNPDDTAAVKRLGADVRVLRGDYEFERLLAWRHGMRPMLGLPGVAFLDVDEARNRVVVGVDSRAKSLDRGGLERELLAAGVPREAVVFQEAAPFEDLVGVRDKLRPVPGGSQIVFSNFICTLGFNAYRNNVFGFIVNSHCTNVRGAVDGTRYSQSVPASGAIGTEIADPGFSTDPPCPTGRRCRMSDAAFVKYDKMSLGGLGKIARTLSGGTETGSLTLKNAGARFSITARTGSPLEGDTVHKLGRTTGWTFGTVIGTCVDANNGTDVTMFCQSVVRAGSGSGDSGSPVFYVLPGNKARLVGILWGGRTDPVLGTLFAFSPLENIEEELGPLKVN